MLDSGTDLQSRASSAGGSLASESSTPRRSVRFGGDFELDVGAYELRRSGRALKLERIPMEVLLLLIERRGQLVTREQIVDRIWGKDVFLDTDNSINSAIRKLRQALKDDPEKPRVILTVTGRGYRFIATIVEPDAPLAVPPATVTSDVRSREQPPQSVRTDGARTRAARWPVPLALALALIAGVAILFRRPATQPKPAGERLMLAVLPFENLTGDPGQEYFSDGLTEEMISRLGNLDARRLGVIARTSVMHYKRTPAALERIGRELGVDYVLEGSVRREADRVRIAAQLIQMSDRTHLWARQYDRELGSVLSVQMEIAQAVAGEIELTLARGSRIGGAPQAPLSVAAYEAYDLYLKGRYFWNKRTAADFEQAVDHFQRAVEKDPTYARAYAGLADSYALMSSYGYGPPGELIPKARSAALRALELDDRLAEAHTSLALIRENHDWDWASAEKEFRRAIELDPNYVTAHHWYAEFLSFQGRFDEAIAESDRARRLDPLSAIIAVDHGAILYFARRYDRAIEQFRAALQMQPRIYRAHMIAWAYAQKRAFPQAFAENEIWRREDGPWNWSFQAWLYGQWGRQDEARRAIENLEKWARDRPSDPMPMLPTAYLGVNDEAKALASLEKLFQERSNVIPTLKVDPVFDPLRADTRFQALLRRAGLAH